MGGIHALEHAAIAMFPLFALCDRDDIGGISTPQHEQVCRAAVFIYDGHPGGVGLARHIYGRVEELLEKTRSLVQGCPCEEGCPSCIHSPKCGSGNKPLDKQACLEILGRLLVQEDLRTGIASSASAVTRPPRVALDVQGSRLAASSASLVEPQAKQEGDELREVTRMGEITEPRRIVVFDLETQKLADEVGGWNNISLMRLSLGVAFTDEHGFLTFTEDTVSDLIDLLKSADLVVGFNQMRFDYEVLSAYSAENLRALPNLDILVEIRNVLGFRIKLDHLAEFTLGTKKSGDGLDAVRWFRDGRTDFLEKYCRDDVKITRDLFRFGLENGYLLYRSKAGPTARIPVDWARYV
jgi:DEAD/DEAH box helicase domain-containing protein